MTKQYKKGKGVSTVIFLIIGGIILVASILGIIKGLPL